MAIEFTCYRVDMGEEEIPEDLNIYSVTIIQPDGDYRHMVLRARTPEDVAEAIQVDSGARVFMTQMANLFVWDSQSAETAVPTGAESTG
ncbi:MAG TPA: hypothetical protein VE134_03730 [Methanomicrobiales archaeon]|nr:hypothetical protein [Methanomicrobiales archaeon]